MPTTRQLFPGRTLRCISNVDSRFGDPFVVFGLTLNFTPQPGRSRIPKVFRPNAPSFTPKQERYLAFIYYTRVLGRPPAETDLQWHFGVSPPSVHQMVLTIEREGLIDDNPERLAASK